ncbi:MAG TPA: carbonic anhydrase [Acidimicrobiales bacterium]|nr:carbonic anhydrase [Acidimicrobiales bacterium]HRA35435.1 carbonic anhydrase [Acidimicrobiales bacterium]
MTYADPPADPAARRQVAVEALQSLLDGNRRFAVGGLIDTKMSVDERAALVAGQHPRAVVLGCVDSRVPPEVVLGQGIGDLLTVRTAGQSLSGVALGSIEFGARSLGVPLVVVLGHTHCGAVLAAIGDHDLTGHLGEMIGEVAARLVDLVGADPIGATGGNLQATVDALRKLGTLSYEGDHAHVVGLLYHLETGLVTVEDDGGLFADA